MKIPYRQEIPDNYTRKRFLPPTNKKQEIVMELSSNISNIVFSFFFVEFYHQDFADTSRPFLKL